MARRVNKGNTKKRRGRPATGRDPVTTIRLATKLLAEIDVWAAKQDDKPSRSEAIRRILEKVVAPKGRAIG
jgi:hypothetical protein